MKQKTMYQIVEYAEGFSVSRQAILLKTKREAKKKVSEFRKLDKEHGDQFHSYSIASLQITV